MVNSKKPKFKRTVYMPWSREKAMKILQGELTKDELNFMDDKELREFGAQLGYWEED